MIEPTGHDTEYLPGAGGTIHHSTCWCKRGGTVTSTPTATLYRAADVLERRAAVATPGPWTLYDRGVSYEINELPEVHDGTQFTHADAAWIATMSPAVAAPLVAILRDEANTRDEWPGSDNYPNEHTLDFARVVLAAVGQEP